MSDRNRGVGGGQGGRWRRAAAAVWLACAGGCTVGPDYTPAEGRTPGAWSGLDPAVTDGNVSTPTGDPAEIGRWWRSFGDETLSGLVERAASANLDVALAESRIRQARAGVRSSEAGLYPSVDVTASASRSRSAVRGGGSTQGATGNFFREGFDAAWEIDVFGGIRRGVEASEASLRSSVEDRRDVLVSLAGEVATNYFQLRGAQSQLLIARRNLAAQRQTLELTQERFDAGFVSLLDVANARAQVAQTSSSIPALEANQRVAIYALGVLLGQEPAALLAELTPEGPIPAPPRVVPMGMPSELLQRRPDIRRAEADLHAATALVGVATADLYPRFSLTGSFGLSGGDVSSLSTVANRFWSIGPAVSWNVFDGGRIRANIQIQEAGAEQALIAYQRAILLALQDVETALVNFSKEQQRNAALQLAVEANREAVDVATQLYSAGRTDFLNVLSAQRQLFGSEDALSQSDRTIGTNLVALYKALGGGWSGEQEPGTDAPTGGAGEAPSEAPSS